MLERESHLIFDPFKNMITASLDKPFTDYNFDSSEVFAHVPPVLTKDLIVECREPQLFDIAILVAFCMALIVSSCSFMKIYRLSATALTAGRLCSRRVSKQVNKDV